MSAANKTVIFTYVIYIVNAHTKTKFIILMILHGVY